MRGLKKTIHWCHYKGDIYHLKLLKLGVCVQTRKLESQTRVQVNTIEGQVTFVKNNTL